MQCDPDGLLRAGAWCCGVSRMTPRSTWSASGSRIVEPSLVRPIEVITGGRERERNSSRARKHRGQPLADSGFHPRGVAARRRIPEARMLTLCWKARTSSGTSPTRISVKLATRRIVTQ